MRITGVESTDLFTGTVGRALQVIRVTVAATEPGEAGTVATVRVMGASVTGDGTGATGPFRITLGEPGEGSTGEVSVATTAAPGTSLPVTAIAETDRGRAELGATITVAEPGWTMWMVSHFHYDPVWWSTQGQFTEARLVLPDEDGELPDTRTAFDLVRLHLEKARRDPDYKFVLAEIDYLKPHFDAFPAERAYLRSLLRDGRAELVGGTYNQPNTNLTGAEMTIRNAVYGMGFQRGVLGADVGSAWMLDAFGFDPGFPALMASAGLSSSSWARGPFHQWGPDTNTRMQFPSEFEWLSPDGSGLLTAYMTNHYGAGWELHKAGDLELALAAACAQFRSLAPVAATPNVLLPVGSDHVIPARWVTDVQREWSARYVWPRFVSGLPREFFAAVRSAAETAPQRYWIMPQTRDMNPVYTGKDVSYSDTKLASRTGETAVLEGERLATLAWLLGARYPAESLDKAWRQLAFGAHHDAITGTEADQVYLDLLAGWREAWQRGDDARRDAIAFLTGAGGAAAGAGRGGAGGPGGLAVTVTNGLARERDAMATVTVRLEEPGTPWLAVLSPDGATELPALAEGVRRHPDGSLAEVTLTFRAAGVPALGFRRYRLRTVPGPDSGDFTDSRDSGASGGSGASGTVSAAGWTDVEGLTIENEAFRVHGDAARGGALGAVTDNRSGRCLLRGPGNELILQAEYDKHPRWGEGPWHLSPKGPGTGSATVAASVRAQRSPAGSRLVASYALGDLSVVAETILWDGAERIEFRTHVSGSIGKDQLLRVRFPASLPGGLPLYQTATAVIGRPFGAPEADVATHWWTLDNPANHWFGVGSVARAVLSAPGGDVAEVPVALGVAEVIAPDDVPAESQQLIKDLLVGLGRAGVTATTSRAAGPRYGSVDLDSNLPDFRIALGGPSENAFTAEVLAACDPGAAKRLAKLVTDTGSARLWVPAKQSRATAFAPGADLRGPRDLPVLILASARPVEFEKAIEALNRDLAQRAVPAETAEASPLPHGDRPLSDGAVAVFNRGTPGAVVTPDGTLWMSLFRACSSWPSGVWIDGDRRTAPDGSSFAWQHWSHTFRYALASSGGSGDWRSAGFNAAAEDFNHDLVAVVTAGGGSEPGGTAPGGTEPAGGAQLSVGEETPNVTLSALKPYGNPLAAGRPGTPSAAPREVTVRLRETDGRPSVARVRLAAGIDAAWRAGLLEDTRGEPLEVTDGIVHVPLSPFETVTLVARVGSPAGPFPGVAAGSDTEPDAGRRPPDAGRAPVPPEPAQPVYARYWLPGKGPAPAGNVPAAVHFTPARVTLNPPAAEFAGAGPAGPGGANGAAGGGGADAAGEDGTDPERAGGAAAGSVQAGTGAAAGGVTLTVGCGPAGASGEVAFDVPAGLAVTVDGAPATGPLRYDLAPNEFTSRDVAVSALPGTADGRYFVGARITDDLGQVLEDTLLVTLGEAGPPDPELEPDELFFRMQSDVEALDGEAGLEVLTPALALAPGETGELAVKVANHLGSQLRGEVQLISPIDTWPATTPWTQSVQAEPGAETTVRFTVTVPGTVEPGWHSWLLVKLMYFGRVRYSGSVPLTVG